MGSSASVNTAMTSAGPVTPIKAAADCCQAAYKKAWSTEP